MLHILALWYFDITGICPHRFCIFKYPHVSYSSNICEILFYNRQLVVIMNELIYVVQAVLGENHCQTGLLPEDNFYKKYRAINY